MTKTDVRIHSVKFFLSSLPPFKYGRRLWMTPYKFMNQIYADYMKPQMLRLHCDMNFLGFFERVN